jgi:P2 family phage contractile tail tube protein
MEVTSLIGAMVYGPNGALFGLFDEVTVPEIKNKQDEKKPTDAIGTRKVPGISLEAMEASFKATGFNSDFHALTSNPFFELGLQIRSNQVKARGSGKVEAKAVKMNLRGWFPESKEGTFKQGEAANPEYKFNVHSVELEVDGRMIKKIDIDNYIWEVDGKDVIADFRKNLGIE